jgi:hypothetical protein
MQRLPPAHLCLHKIREQFGNVDDQVELVAQQLKHLPQLSEGFDAMGFSQGLYRSGKKKVVSLRPVSDDDYM